MRKNLTLLTAVLAITVVAGVGCKHSGIAVSKEGHVVNIDIDAPETLNQGEMGQVEVTVRNVGFNTLNDTIIQVEFPRELKVEEESHGAGMNMIYGLAPNGNMLYQYDVGDIEVTQDSKARFIVRADFGTRERSGDIKVLVWNDDLPDDQLLETKAVMLGR